MELVRIWCDRINYTARSFSSVHLACVGFVRPLVFVATTMFGTSLSYYIQKPNNDSKLILLFLFVLSYLGRSCLPLLDCMRNQGPSFLVATLHSLSLLFLFSLNKTSLSPSPGAVFGLEEGRSQRLTESVTSVRQLM